RAYATIGLRSGASARELKEQYRKLAKTWHPDRWSNDPVSQAEAAQRMRAINDAYATLHRVQTAARVAAPPPREHPADHWSVSHRSMTDEELDAIVRAIGSESDVSGVLRALAWMLPFAAAFVVLQPKRQTALFTTGPTRRDLVMGAILFSTGVLVLIYQKLTKRRAN
ncbi:MAG TPA: J domain-containing protein, partial [Vicinamibacterales bacterium]|nr:J domain-containing protein [Vicinamibacterales bacterium]